MHDFELIAAPLAWFIYGTAWIWLGCKNSEEYY